MPTPDSDPIVPLDPGFYRAELVRRVAAHVADLRAALRSIEDGSYAAKAAASRPGAFLHFGIGDDAGSDGAAARLSNRCLVNLTGELITYIDHMIASRRLLGIKLVIPAHSTADEVRALIEGRLQQEYQVVAQDTRLTNPKKIAEFPGIDSFPLAAALSYFAVRRVMEHRGGVADQDVTLRYGRLKMLAGDTEIVTSGQPAPPNTGISIGMDHEARVITAGSHVAIREDEIEHIMFTIQALIVPEIERVWKSTPVPDEK